MELVAESESSKNRKLALFLRGERVNRVTFEHSSERHIVLYLKSRE